MILEKFFGIILNESLQETKRINMPEIEVDDDVIKFLKKHAEPFEDTPNSVLRRLLLGDKSFNRHINKDLQIAKRDRGSLKDFIDWVLKNEFSEPFIICPPHRMVYESESQIICFQNLNKGESENLWFHIRSKPLEKIRSSDKKAYICLTILSDGYGYLIPLDEVDRHISIANWTHSYLEINIDPSGSMWKELKWKLDEYIVTMIGNHDLLQKDQQGTYPFDLLFQQCDAVYDSNNSKDAFFKSKESLNSFLQRIVTFAHTIGIGPHTAVLAVSLWMKKNHPLKHEKYSKWLDQLKEKEGFEIITLISIIK
jgi:hypothetical protein